MTDEKVKIPANTNEKAFCRIRIPLREQTTSEIAAEQPPKTADMGDLDPDKADLDEVQPPPTGIKSSDDDEEIKYVEEA